MRFLFSIYSWLTSLFWSVLDILPGFLRSLIFRLSLSSCGKKSFIDYKCYIRYMNRIKLGNCSTLNRGCKLFASHFYKDVYIKIGNNVAIGPETTFFAAGHNYNYLSLPDTAESITVCDNVWIGGRSTILHGVTIGEGAVVAAGSVVTKDVKPFSVVAGIPAKFIKDREILEEARMEKINSIIKMDLFDEVNGVHCINGADLSVSFPDDSRNMLFDLEDESFWFKHRNNIIINSAKKSPPPPQKIT